MIIFYNDILSNSLFLFLFFKHPDKFWRLILELIDFARTDAKKLQWENKYYSNSTVWTELNVIKIFSNHIDISTITCGHDNIFANCYLYVPKKKQRSSTTTLANYHSSNKTRMNGMYHSSNNHAPHVGECRVGAVLAMWQVEWPPAMALCLYSDRVNTGDRIWGAEPKAASLEDLSSASRPIWRDSIILWKKMFVTLIPTAVNEKRPSIRWFYVHPNSNLFVLAPLPCSHGTNPAALIKSPRVDAAPWSTVAGCLVIRWMYLEC